jgi:LacI family transcriptional regulator
MTTLKDIATSLNLSIPVVSKVLNNNMGTTGCSAANKAAIRAKASELNYRPNRIAQALRSGRTNSIGVFIHPLGAPGSDLVERLLTGLSFQANASHQRLWLSFYRTDSDFIHSFTKSARSEIDGLLVAGVFHPQLVRLYKAVEAHGIPVVTMFKNTMVSSDMTNVFCDDFQIGYLPTRHLLKNGCRRIAHIRSLDARYQGYVKALHDDGLPEDPALVYTAIESFDTETGRDAVRHWIKNGLEFDALVAESDHQALGAISELLKSGRRVPEDVKVFGVDDSPLCIVGSVPISSVSQQIEETGSQAVQTILRRINKEPTESVSIQPVLRLRASSGD